MHIRTHAQTFVFYQIHFHAQRLKPRNHSLLQTLKASLVMLSYVWMGQDDACNWISAAHILKVSVS